MVAYFAGLGAGFERSSVATLGSGGRLGSSSLDRGGENVFVNAATGNLVLQRQDEFLVGRGPDVAIARTYNSLGDLNHGDNGDLWRQSTDRRVIPTGTANASGSSVKRISADGTEIVYSYNSGLGYYTTTDGAGAHDKLEYASGDWLRTDGDSRFTELYKSADSGWISEVRDCERDGSAIVNKLTFTYLSAGKLDTIATADGGYFKYTWDASEFRITAIETHFTDLTTSTAVSTTRTTYC